MNFRGSGVRLIRMIALSSLSLSALASAEALGIRAQTYPVDRDAREQLKDVVRQKVATGEVQKYWETYRDKTVAAIKNPAPLGIRSDYTLHAVLHPARFVVPNDYRDEQGKLLVRRGTVIEPLHILPLTSGLVFIDGRDAQQVDYAIARGRRESLKIVLTAGSPYALRVKYQHAPWRGGMGIPFYFDQRKIIINTLAQLYGINIDSVPAVLAQRGDQLCIEFGIKNIALKEPQ